MEKIFNIRNQIKIIKRNNFHFETCKFIRLFSIHLFHHFTTDFMIYLPRCLLLISSSNYCT